MWPVACGTTPLAAVAPSGTKTIPSDCGTTAEAAAAAGVAVSWPPAGVVVGVFAVAHGGDGPGEMQIPHIETPTLLGYMVERRDALVGRSGTVARECHERLEEMQQGFSGARNPPSLYRSAI